MTGKLTVDQDANTTALHVKGGGSGSSMAIFERDVGANAQVRIHASGADPQIAFDDMGTGSNQALWAMGAKSGDNSFRIVQNGSIYGATNEFFTLTQAGRVGISTTDPSHALQIDTVDGDGLRVGNGNATSLTISSYGGGNLADVPGSPFGMQLLGPLSSHVVWDIRANDGGDGFFIRVPSDFQSPTQVDTTAFVVKANGRVGIGTPSPTDTLTVKGTIKAEEVIVEAGIAASDITIRPKAWADDVFTEDYALPSIEDINAHIKAEGRLPGVPSAADVATHGISVADMQATLLRKLEEMTLHMIRIGRENAEQSARIAALEAENAVLMQWR